MRVFNLRSGIRLAIGGKGGVGKTTLCAVWAHLFAKDGFDVLAIDADPNVNLALALGISLDKCPQPLISMKKLIAERTGTNKDSLGAYFKMNPKVHDLPDEYSLEHDVYISPILKDIHVWNKNKAHNTLFYQEVVAHGVAL